MNVNIDFKYQEQDLTTHKKNSNILSILSTQDGFVFYVYNKDDTQLLHFEKRTFPPFEYFKSYIDAYKSLIKEILSIYDLSEIRVMFASARVTFIPTAIYTHEQKENLYAINFDQNEFNSIEVFPNTNYQCHILYPVPEWLILFKEEFDIDIRFFNQTIPLLEFVSSQSSETDQEMFINIQLDNIDVVVVKNNQLKFLNSFQYQSNTDFLYYILNVVKQLELNQNDLSINLLGVESKDDEKLKSLPHFIDKLFFYKELKLKYNFALKREHILRYLNFLNLHLCE
jgi:Protein of unknown function (DUF3822)